MSAARVSRSGNRHTPRRLRPVRLKSDEAEILRRGDKRVLREKDGTMVRAFELLARLPKDIELALRGKDTPQKRKGI